MSEDESQRVASWLEAIGGVEAARWWWALPDALQDELIERWAAIPLAGSPERPEEVAWLEASPIDDDRDGPDDPGGWNRDLYEHIVGRPIVGFFLDRRVFHIGCTAHPAARALLRTGRIPAGFRCPLARGACPTRLLIEAVGGRDVQLRCRRSGPDQKARLPVRPAIVACPR